MQSLLDKNVIFDKFCHLSCGCVEVREVYSLVMSIVSVLRKLKLISSHVFINCVATTKLNKSICYVHISICY